MLIASVSLMPHARAQGNDADKILKAMSDYVAGQKTLSVTFDSDIEVITSTLQKIQFTNSGQVQLSRPDKLRATRTGGYVNVDFVFDGKTLSVSNKDANSFVQLEAPGSADQIIDLMREKHGLTAPGADLLLSNAYDIMTADVVESAHVGIGVIDGVECEHLAFRNLDTDWQIWVETGARAIPRKYVITSKGVAGAPQYTLRIKERRTDVTADAFAFKPAQGAKKVAVGDLTDIDEVPQGTVTAGEKNEPHICNSDQPFDCDRCRRCGPLLERPTAAGCSIVANVVSRGQNRPSADADELRGGCPADHATGRGCRGGWAAVYAAPVVVAPAQVCSQAVDAYGRIVTVCR